MSVNIGNSLFSNPFKPGAGHMPPYLAGRTTQIKEFENLLTQEVILKNLVITGLRGVGKTVLLDTLKPLAIKQKWLWVGTDLSEASSLNEENIATRLFADLAPVTSTLVIGEQIIQSIGFTGEQQKIVQTLNYNTLVAIYQQTPGLVSDKLKKVLEVVASVLKQEGHKGLIFAYDEAQNLSDHATKEQYPLSLLLDCFQSLQKKNIPFLLLLTGLPTLFPKLVSARTYSERMFHIEFLDRLKNDESKEAILKPIKDNSCPVKFNESSVERIITVSGGYPYFIQFICREVYDIFIQKIGAGETPSVPIDEIVRKLDADFFSGRWARATDRQRDLLREISKLTNCDNEFTVQEIVEQSKKDDEKPFGASQANQMLVALSNNGLVYKNRHGKYSFAVPLLGDFIRRQHL